MNAHEGKERTTWARAVGAIALASVAATHPVILFAQAPSPDAIAGDWLIDGGPDTLTFKADGEFTLAWTPASAKGQKSREERYEGAYKLAPKACSSGTSQGNLWLVSRSYRCCFQAYVLGKTVVLDEIKSQGPVPALPNAVCMSKTLKPAK